MEKAQSIEEWLKTLPIDGPPWTEEEAKLSTPYSDTETWSRIIQEQLESGRCRFRGPPGLWEKLASQYALMTNGEIVAPPL